MTPKIAVPDEVRRSLMQHPAQGVAVEDDDTHAQYVILPLALYQRLQAIVYDASEPDPMEFMPLAHEAFADEWDAPGMAAYDDFDQQGSTVQ